MAPPVHGLVEVCIFRIGGRRHVVDQLASVTPLFSGLVMLPAARVLSLGVAPMTSDILLKN